MKSEVVLQTEHPHTSMTLLVFHFTFYPLTSWAKIHITTNLILFACGEDSNILKRGQCAESYVVKNDLSPVKIYMVKLEQKKIDCILQSFIDKCIRSLLLKKKNLNMMFMADAFIQINLH